MDPSAAIGRRVSTHYNLQRHAYSVKVAGSPVFLVAALRLADCEFFIDRRLRAQFEARPSRRTVHALIRGTLLGYDTPQLPNGERVRCDPFKFDAFVRASDEQRVATAHLVNLYPSRTIEASGLGLA